MRSAARGLSPSSLPGVARLPSPIQPITGPGPGAATFHLILKRDDLISAEFGLAFAAGSTVVAVITG
ncbi:MAG TPA: hypothetical protein VGJ19_18615 [Streptosporangiaceae bacterium]